MSKDLETLTAALLQAATRAGADAADAMALDGTALGIDTRGGRLEQAERAEGLEFGLRVLIGQRSAVVSGSDARPEVLAAMAERAVAMAREAPEDPYIGLADPALLARDVDAAALELFDPAAEPSPAELEQDAREAEAAAQAVRGVTQVDGASAHYSATRVHLAATNGFSGGYTRSSRSISCVAIAGSGLGMERDHDGDTRIFAADLRGAAEIGTAEPAQAAHRRLSGDL